VLRFRLFSIISYRSRLIWFQTEGVASFALFLEWMFSKRTLSFVFVSLLVKLFLCYPRSCPQPRYSFYSTIWNFKNVLFQNLIKIQTDNPAVLLGLSLAYAFYILIFIQLGFEMFACVLIPSVTMKNGVCRWVGGNSLVEGVKGERVIV